MKKILVLSDSHGNINNMANAARKEQPDQIIHLGDCWQDAVRLQRQLPEIYMEQVPGNCDCQPEMAERVLMFEGISVLICHGHTYNVKSGYLPLQYAAQEKQVDVALFGHTHKAYYDKYNGIAYLNPGSIGSPGFGVRPSYGILTLDGSKGLIDVDVVYV